MAITTYTNDRFQRPCGPRISHGLALSLLLVRIDLSMPRKRLCQIAFSSELLSSINKNPQIQKITNREF